MKMKIKMKIMLVEMTGTTYFATLDEAKKKFPKLTEDSKFTRCRDYCPETKQPLVRYETWEVYNYLSI